VGFSEDNMFYVILPLSNYIIFFNKEQNCFQKLIFCSAKQMILKNVVIYLAVFEYSISSISEAMI
jgi:hypothetical protein